MAVAARLSAACSWSASGWLCLGQFKEGEQGGTKLGQTTSPAGVAAWSSPPPAAMPGDDRLHPVPTDWPEQQVKVVEEDVSPEVTITTRWSTARRRSWREDRPTWRRTRRRRPWSRSRSPAT